MVMNTPACSQLFISVEVYSASTPLPLFGSGNKHVVFSIFTFKNEGIAEIILAISVSVTFQIESAILGPVLKSGEVAYITT